MAQTKRTPQDWETILREQRVRGLTNQETADLNDISLTSLFHWKKRLGKQEKPTSDFVEVPLIPRASQHITIRLSNGVTVEVSLGDFPQVLALVAEL